MTSLVEIFENIRLEVESQLLEVIDDFQYIEDLLTRLAQILSTNNEEEIVKQIKKLYAEEQNICTKILQILMYDLEAASPPPVSSLTPQEYKGEHIPRMSKAPGETKKTVQGKKIMEYLAEYAVSRSLNRNKKAAPSLTRILQKETT